MEQIERRIPEISEIPTELADNNGKTIIGKVTGSMAALFLKKHYDQGGVVEIPSLGLKFTKDGTIKD